MSKKVYQEQFGALYEAMITIDAAAYAEGPNNTKVIYGKGYTFTLDKDEVSIKKDGE